jgi:hypothetical protein
VLGGLERGLARLGVALREIKLFVDVQDPATAWSAKPSLTNANFSRSASPTSLMNVSPGESTCFPAWSICLASFSSFLSAPGGG